MNVRKLRVKAKLVCDNGSELLLCKEAPAKTLRIPKQYIIKTDESEFFSRKNISSTWIILFLDTDYFKAKGILKRLETLKSAGHIFLYGDKKYGVDFDAVITKLYSRSMDYCFYCDEDLIAENRTTEHIIPRAILKAYGLITIDNNTVPCCKECNYLKTNLHPYTFRVAVQTIIKHAGASKKWGVVLQTLNKILIHKKDPLC